jgi:hypothetical protein
MAKLSDLDLTEPPPDPNAPRRVQGEKYQKPLGGLKTLSVPLGNAGTGSDHSSAGASGRTPEHGSDGIQGIAGAALPDRQPSAALEVDLAELARVPYAFLTGPAGTGKTWAVRELAKQRTDVIMCCTTGIAAVNLGDATTINSLLAYFDTNSLWQAYASGWLGTRLRQLRKSGIRIIVVDEVSMLDANQLTVLCQALDDVNLKKAYDASLETAEMVSEESLEMKLILVGDFAQLPPVKADFAFQSPEWGRFRDHTFKLSTIRRQGDSRFIQALGHVRGGRAKQALEVLEPRIVPTLDFQFNGTTIVAKNDEVDRINGLRHSSLPGELLKWPTTRAGEQEKDWLRLIPESVDLKVGALVMLLANMPTAKEEGDLYTQGYEYVNGDLGTVLAKESNGIRVMLHRTFAEVIVRPMTSEWREPTGKKKPPYTVKGAVTRMPLRLAWATTCHKAQGLSLDEVQIGMASWMFGKGGMLYVALSRCRTLEGLRLVGNSKMFLSKCTVDPRVSAWL